MRPFFIRALTPAARVVIASAILAAALAAALVAPANAQGITRATAPIYDMVVVFALPPGFQPAYEDEANGAYIVELIPQGQSVQDWQEMLTLTGVQGLQSELGLSAPETVDWGLDEIANGYQAGCVTEITVELFGDVPPKGADDAVLAHIGCGEIRQTGMSEQMMLWIAVGQGNLYTLQWAERGPAVQAMAFDPPNWFARFEFLNQMALCTPQPAEEAPYPSCLD